MSTIHFILQGKGGVGKSVVASVLHQYLQEKEKQVVGFDTDPVNGTFSDYPEFSVKRIDIMANSDIDQSKFDAMYEEIYNTTEDAHVIIDNGASSFVALGKYIQDAKVVPTLENQGHSVFFHSVITGGQAVVDTAKNLKQVAISFPSSPLVVWLNPFFGEIQMDGKAFEQFKVYEEHRQQFYAIIRLPEVTASTYGKDLEELFAKRMSFKAGINSAVTKFASKIRLQAYWDDLVKVIDNAQLV